MSHSLLSRQRCLYFLLFQQLNPELKADWCDRSAGIPNRTHEKLRTAWSVGAGRSRACWDMGILLCATLSITERVYYSQSERPRASRRDRFSDRQGERRSDLSSFTLMQIYSYTHTQELPHVEIKHKHMKTQRDSQLLEMQQSYSVTSIQPVRHLKLIMHKIMFYFPVKSNIII